MSAPTPSDCNPGAARAHGSSSPAPCSAAPDYDDDDCNYDGPECYLCGDDGWIMLSDAGPSEWGEDCFCELDRPIECPECRDRRRYEAQQAKRKNDQAER
jgi:hypothetical protein